MGMTAEEALGAARSYTVNVMSGMEVIRGKNCTIKSIEHDDTNKLTKVTFLWTDNEDKERTQVMNVPDGLSIKSASIDEDKHLILTLADNTTVDAGLIPEQSVDGKIDVQQDVKDKGKALVIGDDGKVVPKTISGGGGGASTAEDVSYENASHTDVDNVQLALDKLFNKVYYVAPAISSLSATPTGGNYEIGKSFESIAFTWALNKAVSKQTLTGCTITVDDRSATYSTALSSAKTFTLSVEDAEGGKASKNISYNFLPKVYYGGASLPETVDSAFVVGLSNGDLKSSASGTYTMTPAEGKYGFLCIPKNYTFSGTAKVGGFDTDLTLVDTVSVTNASGYTQDYKVWRMPNPSDGSKISIVI